MCHYIYTHLEQVLALYIYIYSGMGIDHIFSRIEIHTKFTEAVELLNIDLVAFHLATSSINMLCLS